MGELYHGSFKEGITRLEPHSSTHGSYVYATPYKELAVIFSARCGDDCTYALYRKDENEPWIIVERIPEAFETMFHNRSSIYTLKDDTFQDIHTGFAEVVSEVGVDIQKEETLDDVYEEVKKMAREGKIQIYLYPNVPKDLPMDHSDIIDKQIQKLQRNHQPITKESFKRIILLHPYLIDKVNQKMEEYQMNDTPYQKEDLIDLFEEAVIKQAIFPEKEQYLKSILITISNTYPELLPAFHEKLFFLDKTKEEKVSILLDKISTYLPNNSIQQMKDNYLKDERGFSEIGKELLESLNTKLEEEKVLSQEKQNELDIMMQDAQEKKQNNVETKLI